MTHQAIRSLLVHDREDRFLILKSALQGLGMTTCRARNCRAAELILCDSPPPHLVFADVVLPDGNWLDLLDLTAKAQEKINLIVVAPRADIGLYIDVMNHGAYDFITESFTVPEIVYVVRTATENALLARQPSAPRKTGTHTVSKESGRKTQHVGAAGV